MTTAASGWGDLMARMNAAWTQSDQGLARPLRTDQKGEAAEAMQDRLNQLSQNYQYVYQESGYLQTVLAALVEELTPVQSELTDASKEASHKGYTVNEDGSVSYPADSTSHGPSPLMAPPAGSAKAGDVALPFSPEPGGMNSHYPEALSIANRIADAVAKATEIDERYTSVLAKVKSQQDWRITDKTWADVAADGNAARSAIGNHLGLHNIPGNKDPKATAKWWKGLTPQQQQEYLALYPDRIGRLDGLPSDIRDRANRDYLPMLISQYEAAGDNNDHYHKLDGFKAIQNRLGLEMGDNPPVYLLNIGDEGQGRATLSYGNPDTADNVSVLEPGTGTGLGSIGGGNADRAKNIWQAAQSADPSRSTASIVTLNYDAPMIDEGVSSKEVAVMGTDRAEQGGSSYDQLLNGLRASHDGDQPHITAIGHSYGTVALGMAATHNGGIPANDMILLGSPGVGVDHASQLGIGADHVYVGAAEADPVTHLPSKVEGFASLGLPNPVSGLVVDVDQMVEPHELWFGQDPASKDFGAHRFAVNPGNAPLDLGAHTGNYMEQGANSAISVRNIGLIVSGHGDKIIRQEPR
ncbi:alpha/beta hydrolase [Streptomyces sp. NPDC054933]